jgi:hypothetical protein
MVISIRGGQYWLKRAVDNEGEVHNVICCADRISRSFAPVHSARGPGHPPPHDARCPLHHRN